MQQMEIYSSSINSKNRYPFVKKATFLPTCKSRYLEFTPLKINGVKDKIKDFYYRLRYGKEYIRISHCSNYRILKNKTELYSYLNFFNAYIKEDEIWDKARITMSYFNSEIITNYYSTDKYALRVLENIKDLCKQNNNELKPSCGSAAHL